MIQNRLLETAVREFGRKGLAGASTRGIATAAGTALSSITYHYGGKEGLYLAAHPYHVSQMAVGAPQLAGEGAPTTHDAAPRSIQSALAGDTSTLHGPTSAGRAP